ncbi:MAG: UDP-N-acetylenolpyruvoylglucosamine reductase [Candidatus Moranbacteria bacterium GW2011_GWE2_35_2-]|nr:MAG: UDP-N-acetylenolpyruvoylglucosamine reductase [Candidatus Moranbacteria bacterium GW2011_GWE2_35_2-]KKQ05082.1 MAG: UDP-N-acetylenolpyruvoylglucosamine reductase [Candidatus Moranbacteria bacterium GW2011_GWF1_36_4]KKQ22817.1 MAG: UDP-N-acetylenolpyruvoylglucosamine reductase [Candidatus Moranbacteria bacterium GW2011_GWF2_37_11]KKQ28828.1 MAG: UDP-N-acetylenolpyruvoylglucosamine reductase [Candidatus Moranbacteria bacterium GW2011_GWD1_37_17]KKQ30952.1 MAG: UDP-N-acetylenolpyruvoylgluc
MQIKIQKDVLLAPYTTFKIGGPARFFVEVKNEEELIEALEYAKENNLEYFILGGGSNILVSDKGFDGMVIKLQDTRYKIQDTNITCGASIAISKLVIESVKNSLTGLEWAMGIPGTVGGAVRGNAGAFGGEIAQNIVSVRAVKIFNTESKIIKLKKEDCKFSYRNSIFKEDTGWIILSVIMNLKQGNTEVSNTKIKEIVRKRIKKQPKYPSAGSFFKNPFVKNEKIIQEFEKETGVKNSDRKIPAGWLIEQVGLKGKKIGGAQVSEKHANFIINTGDATAEDVIILSSLIKQKVRTRFGVQLQEEVQLVGF